MGVTLKLVGITHDEIEGWLTGPGSLGDLGLIDTLTWGIGPDGRGTMVATWTDGNPQIRLRAEIVPDGITKFAKAGGIVCLISLNHKRRALWGPRYVNYVVDRESAGISGAYEWIYRPKVA